MAFATMPRSLTFACIVAVGAAWLIMQAPPGSAVESEGAGASADKSIPMPPSAAAVDRTQRLQAKGMSAGSPIMIRIFKAESELELWMQKGERYELFATYPICYWSGKLGPKLHEGDKQAPEGFYSVGESQIHRRGRWPRSLNIGYPNTLDKANARTGSLILVHGGCTSTGCYAMTNPVMDEIYALAEQALAHGQDRIEVHVFPFRMTKANLDAHASHTWHEFWLTLKDAYDVFERTRIPPKISVCNRRYQVTERLQPGISDPLLAAETACVENQPGGIPLASADEDRPEGKPGRRKAASKTHRHRSAGRNARKAYAAARRKRAAAHARRMRTSQISSPKHAH